MRETDAHDDGHASSGFHSLSFLRGTLHNFVPRDLIGGAEFPRANANERKMSTEGFSEAVIFRQNRIFDTQSDMMNVGFGENQVPSESNSRRWHKLIPQRPIRYRKFVRVQITERINLLIVHPDNHFVRGGEPTVRRSG